jgi:hypothetical protein
MSGDGGGAGQRTPQRLPRTDRNGRHATSDRMASRKRPDWSRLLPCPLEILDVQRLASAIEIIRTAPIALTRIPSANYEAAVLCRFGVTHFAIYQAAAFLRALRVGWVHLFFAAPLRALNVQSWVADDPTAGEADAYEAVTCAICTRVHLVNPKTRKVLGEDDE